MLCALACRALNDNLFDRFYLPGRKLTLEDASPFMPADPKDFEGSAHMICPAPPRSGKGSEMSLGGIRDAAMGRNVLYIVAPCNDDLLTKTASGVEDTLRQLGVPEDVPILQFKDFEEYKNKKSTTDAAEGPEKPKRQSGASKVEKAFKSGQFFAVLRLDLAHLIPFLNALKALYNHTRSLAMWFDEAHNKVGLTSN
jgi:hypothetical protein